LPNNLVSRRRSAFFLFGFVATFEPRGLAGEILFQLLD
jgi:hypothetical protein